MSISQNGEQKRRPATAWDGAISLDDGSGTAPRLLCDLPIQEEAQDHLGFGAYAEALAELIDSPSVATPFTLSIDAPWGAGKTSLARLIERKVREWPRVRGDPPHIVCWFNAWMHSDAPNLGPSLAAAVGKAVARDRPTWRRLASPIPGTMLSPRERRQRRVLVLVFAALVALVAVLALTALHGIVAVSKPTRGWVGVGLLAGVPLAVSLWTSALGVAQAAATFVDNPQSQAATGSMADVASQFQRLVRSATAGRRRLVIFVEDLDRCPPERAMQICETSSLLLSVHDVVTVLIGDVVALRDFARQRFSTSSAAQSENGPQQSQATDQHYGRSYFDKIVQLDFSLPPSDSPSLASMLTDRFSRPPQRERESPPAPTGERQVEPRRTWRRRWGALLSLAKLARLYKPLVTVYRRLARPYIFMCERPRRFAAFVGITFVVLIVIAAIAQALDPRYQNGTGGWGAALVGGLGLIVFFAWIALGVGTVYRWLDNRRTRKSTVQIDETIRDTVASPGETSVETIKQVVAQSIASASSPLIEQRARRAKVEQLVGEGSAELSAYLPDLPRSVKRVANRHYLLASVAVSRKMVGGTPPLTAQHLSKWALIMERWPELAAQIIARPALVGDLEQLARSNEEQPSNRLLSEMIPAGIQHREDLIRLLRDASNIAPVANRLALALPAHS